MAREMRALKGVSLGACNEVSQRHADWYHPALNHMNLYVLSRLYWDADQDVDALLDDYCKNFFGPVATEMKAAIEFAERAYTEAPIVAGVRATSPTNVALEDRLKLI
jgi:alpha-glucuronidase